MGSIYPAILDIIIYYYHHMQTPCQTVLLCHKQQVEINGVNVSKVCMS